jgi:inhibitor of KinA
VGESGLLVDFGDTIDDAINDRVVALDRALLADPPVGLVETIPAYASLMLVFDPLVIAAKELTDRAIALAEANGGRAAVGREYVVPICYEPPFAPDLAEVAKIVDRPIEEVVAVHLSGTYRVFMYGFAPGYAYMGGVPPMLQLPRKPVAERGHPVGSVIIAGPQCLITTLAMPTGWWVIGRSPLKILNTDAERPFLFDPGDTIKFERIGAASLGDST